MAEFICWVKYYHIGLRTYWWQMARILAVCGPKKAYEYFQKFWKTGRDGLSDCRTCERSYAVQMELLMGNRAAADEYAKPMEQGRMRFCPDTPHLYWLAYLEDALDRGDLREAEKRANALYRKGNRDKSDLSYIGAVLRCWAYTDPERALELFAKRLEWSIGLWDQKKVYDFDKGACVLFQRLAKHQQMVHLELPQAFPCGGRMERTAPRSWPTGSVSRQRPSAGALTNATEVTALDTISRWLWQSDKVLWSWMV